MPSLTPAPSAASPGLILPKPGQGDLQDGGAVLGREEKGLLLREGTVMDATIIHAPTSTKNEEREREPQMHQTRKGNQWFFGMKGQIGVDKDSGLIHSVATTAAHVSDGVVAAERLHGEEKVLYGDAGYQGLEKREKMAEPEVDCPIAMGPGKCRHRPDDGEGTVQRWVEHP